MLIIYIIYALILIVCFGVLYTVIATLWANVPFVPTPKRTAEAMIKEAGLKGNETVYDLGAGDARMLVQAKRMHPRINAIGYEIVFFVWLLGKIRTSVTKSEVKLHFKNSFKADLRDADCILLYMISCLMPKFRKKFDSELKPGTKVISHAFQFKDKTPVRTIDVPTRFKGVDKVYVYEW